MADSIFKLGDKFGIASSFGDWLPKRLHITYRGYSSQGTDYVVMFDVRGESIPDAIVTIVLEESEVGRNEVLVAKQFLLKHDGTHGCDLRVPRASFENLSQTILEGEFEFVGRVTCEGVTDAVTSEFRIKGKQAVRTSKTPSAQPKKTCFCGRDFTGEELKAIVIGLRKGEFLYDQIVRDKNHNPILDAKGRKQKVRVTMYDRGNMGELIFHMGGEKVSFKENSFENFAKQINASFKKDGITTCIRKIHFLAQAYHESSRFTKTYEDDPSSSVSGGAFYRGRGLIQVPHDYNYEDLYKHLNQGKQPTPEQVQAFVPTVATSLERACLASTWYWQANKINKYADRDEVDNVSAAINRPVAINGDEKQLHRVNGRIERIKFYETLKVVMDYESCRNKSNNK